TLAANPMSEKSLELASTPQIQESKIAVEPVSEKPAQPTPEPLQPQEPTLAANPMSEKSLGLASTSQIKESLSAPPILKATPFNPYVANIQDVKPIKQPLTVAQKPQSHYDTIIRFAAVEFEGIIKN